MISLRSAKEHYIEHWTKVTGVLAAIAILNFGSFLLVAMYIGGDAINGKIEVGRYYLANHGVLTEVSHRIFVYSYIHALSVVVTHSLFVVNALAGYFVRNKNDA